jgi:hypothetical protein
VQLVREQSIAQPMSRRHCGETDDATHAYRPAFSTKGTLKGSRQVRQASGNAANAATQFG